MSTGIRHRGCRRPRGESEAKRKEPTKSPTVCSPLAKAHIGHAVAGDLAVSGRAAEIDAKISVQADKVADLSKQIADLDAARTIEPPATSNLRTAAAINAQAAALAAAAKLRAADDERRQAKRNSLADNLTVDAKTLVDLKIEKAAVEGERRTVEADLGPLRYLATLLGADNETVLRWFILVVAAKSNKTEWLRTHGGSDVRAALKQPGCLGAERATSAIG